MQPERSKELACPQCRSHPLRCRVPFPPSPFAPHTHTDTLLQHTHTHTHTSGPMSEKAGNAKRQPSAEASDRPEAKRSATSAARRVKSIHAARELLPKASGTRGDPAAAADLSTCVAPRRTQGGGKGKGRHCVGPPSPCIRVCVCVCVCLVSPRQRVIRAVALMCRCCATSTSALRPRRGAVRCNDCATLPLFFFLCLLALPSRSLSHLSLSPSPVSLVSPRCRSPLSAADARAFLAGLFGAASLDEAAWQAVCAALSLSPVPTRCLLHRPSHFALAKRRQRSVSRRTQRAGSTRWSSSRAFASGASRCVRQRRRVCCCHVESVLVCVCACVCARVCCARFLTCTVICSARSSWGMHMSAYVCACVCVCLCMRVCQARQR